MLLEVGNVLKLLKNEAIYFSGCWFIFKSFVLTVNKEITAILFNNITQKHRVHL